MLITKHFVFAHVPKTGGSFIKSVCVRCLPEDWIVSQGPPHHLPVRQMPEQFEGLPIFGLVRNPWDWYVSWYHFTCQSLDTMPDQQKEFWTPLFGEGGATFKEVVTAVCSGVPQPDHPPDWLKKLGALARPGARAGDMYTKWHRRVLAGAPAKSPLEVGRFENLREDFLSFLQRHEIPVDDDFVNQFRREPKGRGSEHERYPAYYDDELRDLVASKNELIDEYGYVFGG